MSLSAIKSWFATVDISDTDWRMRWPLLLLPFLMLALLYFLLRANQLSAQHRESAHDLLLFNQQQVSSTNSEQSGISNLVANSATVSQSFDEQMASMHKTSRQLTGWLTKGKNLPQQAESARLLVQSIDNFYADGTQYPDDAFFSAFSDNLAPLEQAVMANVVNTPEAKDAVQNLRVHYASIRSNLVTGQWLGVESSDTSPTSASGFAPSNATSHAKEVQQQLEQLSEQRSAISRMQNRALVFAALSLAMLGLLFWGLWRTASNQSNAKVGKSRREQSAILQLLDEITPLADGDLRVNATVSEASTGAIADAFNFAVDELRRLVLAVKTSADLVKGSVVETRESAQQLAKASSVQAREIHRSSNYLSVMSDTMAQLSAHAVESSRIADLSVQKARAGNKAVQATVDGLQRIREQADMTSRLMQRLVETSMSINNHVVDIRAVAKRTDLLALNATIRSAVQAGGGMPDKMSELSDDVAYLADTLGRASREIANLADLIGQDAKITLESMAKTVQELDDGQHKALVASDNLLDIDRVSGELNGLISDIASKSLRQAGVVKQLSANMGVINNITRESALELQGSARSLETLQEMTSDLRESVSDFKLPRKPASNTRNKSHAGRTRSTRVQTRKQARVTHD